MIIMQIFKLISLSPINWWKVHEKKAQNDFNWLINDEHEYFITATFLFPPILFSFNAEGVDFYSETSENKINGFLFLWGEGGNLIPCLFYFLDFTSTIHINNNDYGSNGVIKLFSNLLITL